MTTSALGTHGAGFPGCAAGRSAAEASQGLVQDLVVHGFDLPRVYLLTGERLRCSAAAGSVPVVDGFPPGRGLVGAVVRSGADVLLPVFPGRPEAVVEVPDAVVPDGAGSDDSRSDAAGSDVAGPAVAARACAAVRVRGEVVGAVDVESRSPLAAESLDVVRAAAAALGRRLDGLGGLPQPSLVQRLAQISVDLTAATTTADLEQRAVCAATELSGMSTAAMVHLSAGGAELTETHGPLSSQLRLWSADQLEALASWVEPGTSWSLRAEDGAPPPPAFLRRAGVHALSLHPMVAGGRTTGLLLLAGATAVPCERDVLDCLEMLAAQTAALLGLVAARRDLSWRAQRDPLTGLADRSTYAVAVRRATAEHESRPAPVAVLLLDLDDFKHVNDSLGHHAGDRLLCEVARRLRETLRRVDTPCRLGGDEFAVVLPDTDPAAATATARRLLNALARPTVLDGAVLELSASIGIAVATPEQESPEQLMRAADLAMYLAKRRGKGGFALFEPSLQSLATERLALQSDLRKAVRDGALTLAYQPIVDLRTGRPSAVEALLRWRHADRGVVAPADFIPLAEESGLMPPLGAWVLEEACAQLLRWDAEGVDADLRLSVNVSTRQLERPGLLPVVDACLASGVRADRLILEITETALTVDGPRARETLVALRERGVHIAVDDFGTGYSSLDRLRSAPLSRLKIDRVFVAEIDRPGADVPIVDATLAMGTGLGLVVVAEGVETRAQLEHLRRAGCPEAQGFLLSPPLAPEAVPAILGNAAPWAALFA